MLKKILRAYLLYLKSLYCYGFAVAWNFASAFSKEGFDCFNGGNMKGNMFYDELCMIEEGSGKPDREMVSNYGNKLVIGRELIMVRYNQFKEYGVMTHFTSNATPAQIEEHYGERSFSRLNEMCNIIPVGGEDRRTSAKPVFVTNVNAPKIVGPKEPDAQVESAAKSTLEGEYQKFVSGKPLSEDIIWHYTWLETYGCSMGTDKDKDDMYQECMLNRRMEIDNPSKDPVVERQLRAIRKKYESGDIAKEEHWNILAETKRNLVVAFYQRLKDKGCKTIFGVRDVKIDLKK